MTAFLQGPWTARLAVVRPDGQPHVIPVWQEWDGEVFTIIAWKGSQWAEHLLQNPNVSLTIDEPWPPLRRVVVRGQAAPLNHGDDIPGLEALVQRLTRRYLARQQRPERPVQYAFLQPISSPVGRACLLHWSPTPAAGSHENWLLSSNADYLLPSSRPT